MKQFMFREYPGRLHQFLYHHHLHCHIHCVLLSTMYSCNFLSLAFFSFLSIFCISWLSHYTRSQDSIFSIATRLWAGQLSCCDFTPDRDKRFILASKSSSSWLMPTQDPIHWMLGGLFAIGKTGGLTTHLHLLTRIRMCGTLPPFLHMLLWHGAWLSRGKIYYRIENYHHYTAVSSHLLLDHVYICLLMRLGIGTIWFAVSIPWKVAKQKTVFSVHVDKTKWNAISFTMLAWKLFIRHV